ncbi:hypothetical protein B0T13DRAFT_444999 [Neurospora crassa]|nr:hypothetical protein B0T13DRAFT_444999 [Neurospora crassa]
MENAAARPPVQPSPMGVVSALFAAFLRPVAVLPLRSTLMDEGTGSIQDHTAGMSFVGKWPACNRAIPDRDPGLEQACVSFGDTKKTEGKNRCKLRFVVRRSQLWCRTLGYYLWNTLPSALSLPTGGMGNAFLRSFYAPVFEHSQVRGKTDPVQRVM